MRPGLRRRLERGSADAQAQREKAPPRTRKAEHPFLYANRHFGYAMVRYRGLEKNHQRLALLLGFAKPVAGRASARVIARAVRPASPAGAVREPDGSRIAP